MKREAHPPMHRWLKHPVFPINHRHLHTAFFVETWITTIIITLVFVLDDLFVQYMEQRRLHKVTKYVLHTIATFACVAIVLYSFLFLFGYGQVIMVT